MLPFLCEMWLKKLILPALRLTSFCFNLDILENVTAAEERILLSLPCSVSAERQGQSIRGDISSNQLTHKKRPIKEEIPFQTDAFLHHNKVNWFHQGADGGDI